MAAKHFTTVHGVRIDTYEKSVIADGLTLFLGDDPLVIADRIAILVRRVRENARKELQQELRSLLGVRS